ncbi:molybdopterin biosynthesis protein moeA [Vibrio sp. JCM 19236]|nr:molybdopterin biosynthesis protein moeA [Vibrio sp. JCM 19236]
MLASLGVATVDVFRKPIVAVFSTGDELKPVGTELQAGEIYDSNRYGMRPLFDKFGCEVIDLGIILTTKSFFIKRLKKPNPLLMWWSPLAA